MPLSLSVNPGKQQQPPAQAAPSAAFAYAERHGVVTLLEHLIEELVLRAPSDPVGHLIAYLDGPGGRERVAAAVAEREAARAAACKTKSFNKTAASSLSSFKSVSQRSPNAAGTVAPLSDDQPDAPSKVEAPPPPPQEAQAPETAETAETVLVAPGKEDPVETFDEGESTVRVAQSAARNAFDIATAGALREDGADGEGEGVPREDDGDADSVASLTTPRAAEEL